MAQKVSNLSELSAVITYTRHIAWDIDKYSSVHATIVELHTKQDMRKLFLSSTILGLSTWVLCVWSGSEGSFQMWSCVWCPPLVTPVNWINMKRGWKSLLSVLCFQPATPNTYIKYLWTFVFMSFLLGIRYLFHPYLSGYVVTRGTQKVSASSDILWICYIFSDVCIACPFYCMTYLLSLLEMRQDAKV